MLDDEKRSALVLAVKNNHGDVAVALVKAGANPNTPYTDDDGEAHKLVMDAITVENEEFAIFLAEKDVDLYIAGDKKVTTLLKATPCGWTDVVKILLEKHAASGKSGYLDDRTIVMSYGNFEGFKVCREVTAWRGRLPSWRERHSWW
jgi:ankyrin repeat protein